MTKITYIPGEIANAAIDEHGNRKPVTRTQHIFDDTLNKSQSQINEDTTEAISDEVTRAQNAESGLDTRLQAVEELAEISVGGGDIQIANTGEDIQPGSGKVATANALADAYGYLVENPEWIYVLLDSQERILAGLKSDGSVEWSIGIPTPVKTYIDNAIAEIKNGTEGIDLNGLNKIIAFLSDFSTSDTLKDLLDKKVDKEEGKSLIDEEYAEGVHYIENPEFAGVWLDNEGKILFGVQTDGNFLFGCGVPRQVKEYIEQKIEELSLDEYENIVSFIGDYLNNTTLEELLSKKVDGEYVDNPEWLKVIVDAGDRVLFGVKVDGSVEWRIGIPTAILDYLLKNYNTSTETNSIVEREANRALQKESELNDRIDSLDSDIIRLSIKQKAKTVVDNQVDKFRYIKPQEKDIYVTLVGDSIMAFQSAYEMDSLGVAAVPPTCDKSGNANQLWNAVKWGNAVYRRFDYGKQSLVGQWDSTWDDDTNAYFTENGEFKTEYIGEVRREEFIDKIGPSMLQVSTHIDVASFPYQFDNSEDYWWQRNIPKRFSNTENASVSFTIPRGYRKVDFIFHAHINGDVLSIITNRNNGIVKLNSKQNDWDNSVEANNATFNTNLSEFVTGSDGNDSFGIPNMRLHFYINDVSQDTTITIQKSANTEKYLIYWGISYWGTEILPYALHIDNQSVGGYSMNAVWNIRNSMIKATNPDAIVMEICSNNLRQSVTNGYKTAVEKLSELKTYFGTLNIDIASRVGVWIPHASSEGLRDWPLVYQINVQGAEKGARDLGYNIIGNAKKVMSDLHDVYYSNKTESAFMSSLTVDGLHLNYNGFCVYSAMWETLR